MSIQRGNDGNWYAVWSEPNAGWDFIQYFPGARLACFGQFENALQLTGC